MQGCRGGSLLGKALLLLLAGRRWCRSRQEVDGQGFSPAPGSRSQTSPRGCLSSRVGTFFEN